MAAAYAALVSLMNVLIRVQHPTYPAIFDESQIKALYDRVSLLVDFLETHSPYINKDLRIKITDAVNGAQDRIESSVMVRIDKRLAGKRVDLTRDHLDDDIQRMDLFIQEAEVVKQLKKGENNQEPRSSLHVASSQPPSGTLQFVGFEEEVNHLLERLAVDESSREVIPIVGMGGIGKSTLAVSVYNLPYVRDKFHVKAWVTISHLVYDIGTVIHSLLDQFGVLDIDYEKSGEKLHKYLFGRKYLIVLDDIWDIKDWEGISRFLPDNGNGSRVIITTRNSDVARSVGSDNPYEMLFLDDEKSWDLLSKMVFGQEVCPAELETYGKGIAKGCKGLPLAVSLIGGMLKAHDVTSAYWAYVGENVHSIISRGDDELCLNILSWSYHDLPIHLKPCFLYMASFPEDYEIPVSDLTRLWAADGFLKPKMDNTLEEIALDYLDNLVKRNIVIVKKRDSSGSMKCLILHDLVRDLCIREARAERFLSVDDGAEVMGSSRRLAVHEGGYHHVRGRIQSLLWFWRELDIPNMSWLRVFFSLSHTTTKPDTFMPVVNLRFVKSTGRDLIFNPSHWTLHDSIVPAISASPFMWNIETLILDLPTSLTSLPPEIWKFPHINHLIFSGGVFIPDPSAADSDSVLSNLQELKKVIISSNTVLYRIPNIKELHMQYAFDFKELPGGFGNLVHCHKLEKLYLGGIITSPTFELFPSNLKKLTLYQCQIPWERMSIVGSLPNLQVLKLKLDAFKGKEWSSTEGEFQSLKVLSMKNCTLGTWIVENSSHFPCLEHLSLYSMEDEDLEEVPQIFGESMTLKSIRLRYCKASVILSAKQILDQHESYDNYDFTVEAFNPYWDNEDQLMELKSLASDRFHLAFDDFHVLLVNSRLQDETPRDAPKKDLPVVSRISCS